MVRVFGGFRWQAAAAAALLAAALSLVAVGAKAPTPASKATVLLFLSTDCPVAARYTPRIQSISRTYAEKGIEFRALFPNDRETVNGIQNYAKDRGYGFPVEIDLGGTRARSLGVKIVPTAIVLDASGKIAYQGPIDDHKDSSLVKRQYLSDALDALLGGQPPKETRAEPFGCVLMAKDPLPPVGKTNYAEHVKPILDRACIGCHRPGEVAPFSLIGYENAKKWSPMIEVVASSRKMPPWKAVHGYGEFQDENVLTEVEIETLKRWNEAGAPRGDKAKEPKTPSLPSGEWPFGEPDLVLTPQTQYELSADGADDYRHFILKTDFKETKWVKAMAVKPGNKLVVHHVIAYIDETGKSHRLDRKDGKEGYSTFGGPGFLPDGSFGGWAPGLQTQMTPEGTAFELKPGATVVMEVHYHKTGKPETDRTKLGLYFADEPIKKVMTLAWLANPMIYLKAGDPESQQVMRVPIPSDVTLYNVMPHMHLLAKSMRAEVEFPGGARQPLIFVDDWDFNWQLSYAFKEPIKVPKGSTIHIRSVYDNSAKNPNNPSDPPKDVRWGEQTTDEMMLLVVAYTIDKGMRPSRSYLRPRRGLRPRPRWNGEAQVFALGLRTLGLVRVSSG